MRSEKIIDGSLAFEVELLRLSDNEDRTSFFMQSVNLDSE
jgi:hypothetical protein